VQSPSPLFKEKSKWYRTAIHYNMNKEKIRFLINQRYEEFKDIEKYMESKDCLMGYLRHTLNDNSIEDCGKCANCNQLTSISSEFSHDLGVRASKFLKHHAIPIKIKKQFAKDAFPQYGFTTKIPIELQHQEGIVLSKWMDAGWGKIVAENKHNNHFNDELVDAFVDMIQEWNPTPKPKWITCVPSLKHTTLVPSFAQRVAKKMALPFKESIIKSKHNEAQKMMQNRFYQCNNLDGAFEIIDVLNEPVLLIDDIVDSGWTFTVLSALLRRAGAGEVFPVALTSTANG